SNAADEAARISSKSLFTTRRLCITPLEKSVYGLWGRSVRQAGGRLTRRPTRRATIDGLARRSKGGSQHGAGGRPRSPAGGVPFSSTKASAFVERTFDLGDLLGF